MLALKYRIYPGWYETYISEDCELMVGVLPKWIVDDPLTFTKLLIPLTSEANPTPLINPTEQFKMAVTLGFRSTSYKKTDFFTREDHRSLFSPGNNQAWQPRAIDLCIVSKLINIWK